MSHHGDKPFDAHAEKPAQLVQAIFLKSNVWSTGDYPQGKLTKSDEGQLVFAVGHRDGKVVLDFGGPVAWVGMDPSQAFALASSLAAHARKARAAGERPSAPQYTAKALQGHTPGLGNKAKAD